MIVGINLFSRFPCCYFVSPLVIYLFIFIVTQGRSLIVKESLKHVTQRKQFFYE